MSRDRMSPLAKKMLEAADERRAFFHERIGGLTEAERLERQAEYQRQYDEYKARLEKAEKQNPLAVQLAATIMDGLPSWCEGEECEVNVFDIVRSLDRLGLKLVPK